jgi:hypothetical protein
MATSLEIRTLQKTVLTDLLEAKKGKGDIDDLIRKMRATMEAEDFAYVEKVVNGEYDEK